MFNNYIPSTEICARDITSTLIMANQNKKEIDICLQHLEKMLKKIYSGRQLECSNSNQRKIDHKIKGVNDDNGETQKEEENITQDDRKTEHETGM